MSLGWGSDAHWTTCACGLDGACVPFGWSWDDVCMSYCCGVDCVLMSGGCGVYCVLITSGCVLGAAWMRVRVVDWMMFAWYCGLGIGLCFNALCMIFVDCDLMSIGWGADAVWTIFACGLDGVCGELGLAIVWCSNELGVRFVWCVDELGWGFDGVCTSDGCGLGGVYMSWVEDLIVFAWVIVAVLGGVWMSLGLMFCDVITSSGWGLGGACICSGCFVRGAAFVWAWAEVLMWLERLMQFYWVVCWVTFGLRLGWCLNELWLRVALRFGWVGWGLDGGWMRVGCGCWWWFGAFGLRVGWCLHELLVVGCIVFLNELLMRFGWRFDELWAEVLMMF